MIIPQIWGEEEVLYLKDSVQFKRLYIRRDEMTDLQYHNKKEKVVIPLNANCGIRYSKDTLTKELEKNSILLISKGTPYCFTAMNGDAIIAELSVGDEEDVVKLTNKHNEIMK